MTLAKNATIFTFSGITFDALEQAVNNRIFTPCGTQDGISLGFVPPVDNTDRLVRVVDNIATVLLREDSKVLPANVVKEEVRLYAERFEKEQGYAPGRKLMREIKEKVIMDLLAKAFINTTYTRAWLDFKRGLLVVDSASSSKVESLIGMLIRSMQGDRTVTPWRTNGIPQNHFTNWVQTGEPPVGFTIDDRALFKDHEGGTIRITNEDVNLDDIRYLVEHGRQCIELALTYKDSISFVLTKDLIVKRIIHFGIDSRDPNQTDMMEDALHDQEIILSAQAIRDIFDTTNEVMGGLAKLEVEAA
ncbi:recombination-associated protein RdgC [Nitrosomonas sp.]|uniref:recombination-associated protein RdgC n=1 Tax=Nitrosomonas sp. TaxID=42353 RepID=UPI00262B5362|nr:recombination-associated protein RdgC [Nitrosomonas sp.]MCW5600450.1 recombination-associated protein RdgC [Nitrosomonas sp.]